MRISDWSSDVCSSDLESGIAGAVLQRKMGKQVVDPLMAFHRRLAQGLAGAAGSGRHRHPAFLRGFAGRCSDLDQLLPFLAIFPVIWAQPMLILRRGILSNR